MRSWNKWWLGTCFATVLGQGTATYTGYAPGTCTDQQVQPPSQSESLKPCTERQSSSSIRSNRYRRTYGGK